MLTHSSHHDLLTTETTNLLRQMRRRMFRLVGLFLALLVASASILVSMVYLSAEAERKVAALKGDLEASKASLQKMEDDCAEKLQIEASLANEKLSSAKREIEALEASVAMTSHVPDVVKDALLNFPEDPPPSSDNTEIERECNRGRGSLASCTARAYRILGTTEPRADLQAWGPALKWLEWGCPASPPTPKVQRDPGACLLLGRAFRRGTPGKVVDKGMAAKYYKLACYLGNARGCLWAGDIEYDHVKDALKGGHYDNRYTSALSLLSAACEGGDGEGCYLLAAAMSYDKSMTSKDIWRMVKRACSARYLPACTELGRYPALFRNRSDEGQIDGILQREE